MSDVWESEFASRRHGGRPRTARKGERTWLACARPVPLALAGEPLMRRPQSVPITGQVCPGRTAQRPTAPVKIVRARAARHTPAVSRSLRRKVADREAVQFFLQKVNQD